MTSEPHPAEPRPRLATVTESFPPTGESHPVEWRVVEGRTDYPDALAMMEERVAAIADGRAAEAVFLVEHPPLYTAGTKANIADLVDTTRFPVFSAGRGGEYTYHGPGQRVAYVLLDLRRRTTDIRAYVAALEGWIIATLADFHVVGERREDRVGVWVRRPERPTLDDGRMAEDKVAAIGIRIRRWVTFHGIALNVDPDLDHFSGIVPCGVRDHGVTSLTDLGIPISMPEVDSILRQNFERIFGPTVLADESQAPQAVGSTLKPEPSGI